MCLSCGCSQPNESHGNEDHITMNDLERAADAAGTRPAGRAEHLARDRLNDR